jgi:hypothetical protein
MDGWMKEVPAALFFPCPACPSLVPPTAPASTLSPPFFVVKIALTLSCYLTSPVFGLNAAKMKKNTLIS